MQADYAKFREIRLNNVSFKGKMAAIFPSYTDLQE